MIFVSFYFYIFLSILVAIYYILPLKFRWYSLLAASLGFYWYISEYSIIKFGMFLGAAVLCWILSLLMEGYHKFRKPIFILNLLIIIFPLLAIKEMPFVASVSGRDLPGWWIVPVGIAFYTLQLIAYVVDIYSGKIKPETNILKFILFVGFFPQIIQGPIPRFSQLSHQLSTGHRFDETKFVKGFMLILWGFFLKLCIADRAAIVVNTVFDNYEAYRGAYVLVAGTLYCFQLYTDFSACTYLTQGMAALFGIQIADNFRRPFFSTSMKEIWQRWHISLSRWLRDYIYIPLGGGKNGKFRKYINLIITFLVSGLWHGSGYKYLVWALLIAFYQVMGEFMEPVTKKIKTKPIKQVSTFILFMLVFIIFRANSLRSGISMLWSMVTVHNIWILTNDSLFGLGLDQKEMTLLVICLFVLYLVSKKQEKGIVIRDEILKYTLPVRWSIYIGGIIFVMIFGTYGYGFDARAFIYGGF